MLAKIEIEDRGAEGPPGQRWICWMQGDFPSVYVTAASLSEIWKKMSKFYPEKKVAAAQKPVSLTLPPVAPVRSPPLVRAVPRHPAPTARHR